MDVEAAKQIFSAGEYLEQDGKIEQAIACYQQASKLHPEYYQYHYKLGAILRQQNRLEQAIPSFHQAIALNADFSWSYHALAEVYNLQQAFSNAIEYYQKAIELNADFSWSHYNLGRIFHQQKQIIAARSCYEKAIAIDPNFDWSHYFLAEVLATVKEDDSAIYHYQKAIELNPCLHEAHYKLGIYQQNSGQLEQAVEHYNLAIENNQQEYDYYYHLGGTLIQLKRFSQAVDCYEKAIALKPNNLQAYFYLGQALINQGKNAISNYRNAVKDRSQLFRVNLEIGLAQAWQQREEFSQSIECCQNAIKIDCTAEIPFKILQYIPTKEDELDRLVSFYKQVGKSSQICPLLWGNLGDILTKQSRIEEAIDCYHTSCYENIIIKNTQLAELNWQQNKQKAPDFIIIGSPKSGTTSLFSYLNQNSKILAPHRKEINFFNHNFDLGISWYLAQFPGIIVSDRTNADLESFITGEASPSYIYSKQVMIRIKQLFPNVKLIAMLRNPIERTISEYYHAANHGIEKRSLEEIIEIEKKQLATFSRSEVMQTFGYLQNSIYVEKIAKWMDEFPSENILIIESESLFDNTASTMKEVCQFLNIPEQKSDRHIAYNVGTYPAVSTEIRQKLKEFFIPYNQKLEEYLGRKFNWEGIIK